MAPLPSVRRTRLDREFLIFHRQNPHIYNELVILARRAKAAGRRKAGIGMLWEVLRWDIFIRTTGTDYKLNNNHRSRYARLIMAQERDLADFFDVRELAA